MPSVALPRGLCQFSMGIIDPCATLVRPTINPLGAWRCAPGAVDFNITDVFTGGERVRVESGCEEDCGAYTEDRCWDSSTGDFTTCPIPLDVEAQFTGQGAFVVGGVTKGINGSQKCPQIWAWIEAVEKLEYAQCETGSARARRHIWPLVRISYVFQGMKKGPRANKFDIIEARRAAPPAGYTGLFGDIPATFFGAANTNHHFQVDLAVIPSLPVGATCSALSAVA